jgi:hypothetical protein
MRDLPTLAATLLANFVTISMPLYEPRWAEPRPELSVEANYRSRADALRVEHLIARCHRQHLQILLLEDGHGAFLDFIEYDGLNGWRLHFFCIDTSAVAVLKAANIGILGEGDPIRLDPQQFVLHQLHELDRAGCLAPTNRW